MGAGIKNQAWERAGQAELNMYVFFSSLSVFFTTKPGMLAHEF